MNIKTYLYAMRKRISDKELLELEVIIKEEIERRTNADNKAEISSTGRPGRNT